MQKSLTEADRAKHSLSVPVTRVACIQEGARSCPANKMEKLVAFAVFSCVISVVQGQVFSWGKCPDVPVKFNFSADAYLGRWFEIARFPTSFEKDLKCVQANYSLLEDNTIQVVNRGQKKCCGDETKAVGVAWAPDPEEPAKLLVRFQRFLPAGPYWVLDTDYSRYSVVWSCVNLFWGVARRTPAEGHCVRPDQAEDRRRQVHVDRSGQLSRLQLHSSHPAGKRGRLATGSIPKSFTFIIKLAFCSCQNFLHDNSCLKCSDCKGK